MLPRATKGEHTVMNPKTEYVEDQWREKRYRAGGQGDRFQQRACAACSYGMHGRLSKVDRDRLRRLLSEAPQYLRDRRDELDP